MYFWYKKIIKFKIFMNQLQVDRSSRLCGIFITLDCCNTNILTCYLQCYFMTQSGKDHTDSNRVTE